MPPRIKRIYACHCELDNAILGHQPSDKRCVFLTHVLVVILFAHAGLAVSANRPLKQSPRLLAVGSHLEKKRDEGANEFPTGSWPIHQLHDPPCMSQADKIPCLGCRPTALGELGVTTATLG
jgi:hypothetical protein